MTFVLAKGQFFATINLSSLCFSLKNVPRWLLLQEVPLYPEICFPYNQISQMESAEINLNGLFIHKNYFPFTVRPGQDCREKLVKILERTNCMTSNWSEKPAFESLFASYQLCDNGQIISPFFKLNIIAHFLQGYVRRQQEVIEGTMHMCVSVAINQTAYNKLMFILFHIKRTPRQVALCSNHSIMVIKILVCFSLAATPFPLQIVLRQLLPFHLALQPVGRKRQ